ncbi:MAG: hypothetical protein KGJ34_00720 [Patescibacteria group bacterium]|nr:hypothetical protein [Patescibacteria group bacterium]
MEYLRTHKNFWIGLIVCLLIVGALWWWWQGSSAPSTPLSSTATVSGTSGSNLLTALSNLQAVKLDDAIFSNPEFQSLTDFGITIPIEPVGRIDPFAPLPSTPASGGAVLPSNIQSGTASGKGK